MEATDDREELVEVIVYEDGLGSFGGESGEGRVVDAAGVDGAVLGEVVDHHLDETDLVDVVAFVVEELGECVLGGGAVEADETANEQSEASSTFGGFGESSGVSDTGANQNTLQVLYVGGREWFAAVDFGHHSLG